MIPKIIPLVGHSNFHRKNLIFKNQEDKWYTYTLDLEIPSISIHGETAHPIAIDVDGGPIMGIGFQPIEGLTLDRISNKIGEPITLYFKYEPNTI